MANADFKANRPLSPHLQVYRLILTMLMSILHRITGAGLYFGTILMAFWLICAASGPEAYEFANGVFGSWIGRLILFGFTWALVHHMLGGLRHFVWDMGRGFQLEAANWMAKATIIGSVSLTILLWIIGYVVR
ncbi:MULTISPECIES: succinate dehydrogenase, cytochrome b556 subunit [Pseudovibrio]|uniref:succinate dehydrogenase, cytochrome b556 subunit n=1 Tax=Stappiaceae TaxID=2821832 RepID=UPI0023671FB4|nr:MULTISPECIES: succinate dehydrogenase, cytochrome b556 subunit [Pseudovibrio]MDD7909733.1 succinate dehydrogenase, cytochrome b556 subunit [Pseudovibrio exalbescens]MDX5592075.1 succinate dehydrogenase, cytochrome b556 subunit [Pseudovibrio sp. SPO723]